MPGVEKDLVVFFGRRHIWLWAKRRTLLVGLGAVAEETSGSAKPSKAHKNRCVGLFG